jgi:hypothetical protein
MAGGWSFREPFRSAGRRDALTSAARVRRVFFPDEHIAVLRSPAQFDSLHRKDNFLAEGVDTIFGLKQGEAELQAFCFRSCRFTRAQARAWLRERGLRPLLLMGKDSL